MAKYALCIGIDDYPDPNRLSGCENDANDWNKLFRSLGFQSDVLLSRNATLNNIVGGFRDLVGRSSAGDILAIHCSSHGTRFKDLNGDEPDGMDEALCPVDFATRGCLVDDDIGPILDSAPEGVAINVFFDFCHSGTATRMLAQSPKSRDIDRSGMKVRFMPPTPEMTKVHFECLEQRKRDRRQARTRGVIETQQGMREVLFAACQPSENALESNGGNGAFTEAAIKVLSRNTSGLTNEAVMRSIVGQMQNSRQTPQLSCKPGDQSAIFLAGSDIVAPSNQTGSQFNSPQAPPQPTSGSQQTVTFDDLSNFLDSLSRSLSQSSRDLKSSRRFPNQ